MNEPAIDLAIVLALISSYKDIAIDEKHWHSEKLV